jgi:bacterioferritin
MKGDEKLLKLLNGLLADELAAVNQYIVHSEMNENWGYEKLSGMIKKRAIDEMKHAEQLIARIIFLEGLPIVSKLSEIKIGADVPRQFANDRAAEFGAIKSYNVAITYAAQVGDGATRELLEHILKDEDDHINKIEEAQDQIKQMTLPLYLNSQTAEGK